jgi:hypothetical protein
MFLISYFCNHIKYPIILHYFYLFIDYILIVLPIIPQNGG